MEVQADNLSKLKWDISYPTDPNALFSENHIKIVAVGDGAVGKTCMLITFISHAFPGEYIPTQLDFSYGKFDEESAFSMSLWDTAGREDYDRLRPLSYPGTRVTLICFSVTSPTSFDNVSRLFVPEVSHHLPGIPQILVGCKIDLRDDADMVKRMAEKDLKMITYKQGEEMAKAMKMTAYYECSALKQIGLNELFAAAIKHGKTVTVAKNKRGRKWQLVWSDEFNADSLNSSNWNIREDLSNNTVYDSQAVSISDGYLTISTDLINDGSYASGWVDTVNNQYFKYGRFEVRAQMPSGNGIWPLIALNSQSGCSYFGAEIQMVHFQGEYPQQMGAFLQRYGQCSGPYETIGESIDTKVNLAGSFHSYAVEWNSSFVTWYFDDEVVASEDTKESLDSSPLFWAILVSVEDSVDTTTVFPAITHIDFVKYYVWKDPNLQISTTALTFARDGDISATGAAVLAAAVGMVIVTCTIAVLKTRKIDKEHVHVPVALDPPKTDNDDATESDDAEIAHT